MVKLRSKNYELEGSVEMLLVAFDYAHQPHSHIWMKRNDGKWECNCGIVLSDKELATARAWGDKIRTNTTNTGG